MMAGNKWNSVEMRDNRYNQILHLVSAANGAEEFYSTEVSLFSQNVVKRFDFALLLWPRPQIQRKESVIIRYTRNALWKLPLEAIYLVVG